MGRRYVQYLKIKNEFITEYKITTNLNKIIGYNKIMGKVYK